MDFKKRFTRHRGITVIQKRDPRISHLSRSKVALVLAGGAISGGAFKVGGLHALDEVFRSRKPPGQPAAPFSLTDFDLFVGLSAGSVLASTLASGVPPHEMLRIVMGSSKRYEEFRASDFIAPSPIRFLRDLAARAGSLAGHEHDLFTNWLSGATDVKKAAPLTLRRTLLKMASALPRIVPPGLFSTDRLGDYLRRNMQKMNVPDDFVAAREKTGKELFLTAVDLNRGELMVFGHDEPYRGVPISEAIRASCALPGWYEPVRVPNPRADEPGEPSFFDLVDGGLMRTANVRVAVEKGADLVICYNPFTNIKYERLGRSLVDHGPFTLVSQLFRILLGARLDLAKELLYRDETIDADIIFVEPAEDDFVFFRMNPLRHAMKERAAAHGYRSIRAGIESNRALLAEIFATHGIELHPPDAAARPWGGHEVDAKDLRESRG